MKTEKEIEEMARDLVSHLNSEDYCTIEEYSFHEGGIREGFEKGYTQAQKDLLAEASEGFEEWVDREETKISELTGRGAWQASRLPLMKKIEELEKARDYWKFQYDGENADYIKLQKENEELRTNFHHFMDKVQYVMPHKIEPEGCCSGRDCACMGKPINPEYYVQQLKEEYSAKWSLDKEGGK